MRNKKMFSFNEERDAEKIYNNGFDGGIDYSKMYLVAKYIRQTFAFGEIRLEKELIRFCKKQDNNFNPVKEAQAIHRWINSAMNYNLRKIENVPVSEKEIDFLKTIENNKDRKLLYIILIFAKALKKGNVRKKKKGQFRTSDYYYVHYNNFQDIIRLSKLNNISETDLADILHNYREHFTFYNAERELVRVDYIDKKIKNEIEIRDLNNMADYYNILFEHQKPNALCVRCGNEIKKNSNKQKYCKKCAKEVKKEQHRKIMQRIRANEKRDI